MTSPLGRTTVIFKNHSALAVPYRTAFVPLIEGEFIEISIFRLPGLGLHLPASGADHSSDSSALMSAVHQYERFGMRASDIPGPGSRGRKRLIPLDSSSAFKSIHGTPGWTVASLSVPSGAHQPCSERVSTVTYLLL